jgi:endonuclease/exonuclease/phosphatase family metal-dependent hydrolase
VYGGRAVALRVLTWNLKHGRAEPPAGRDLFDEFAGALDSWSWDVALLQEIPPWWPPALGRRLGCDARLVLTSRNALLPVRKAIAVRWPDVIKSNGGGANAILVRGQRVDEHRVRRLCWWPERRWVHAVGVLCGLGGGGGGGGGPLWVGNLHATVHDDAAARRDGALAAASVLEWAAGAPAILGGDFNVRRLGLDGFAYGGGLDVDHVFVSGGLGASDAEVLDRGRLSDHAPVAVSVAPGRCSLRSFG